MPLFDLECRNCDHKLKDELFPMGKTPRKKCPECGKMMRQIYTNGASFRMEFRPGFNIGAGEHFETKRQRDTFYRENGLRRIG